MNPTARYYLHGFLGCPKDFDQVTANLRTVEGPRPSRALPIAGHPDVPFPCDSEGAVDSAFRVEVGRLARQIELEAKGPVELIGYSMGGRLALGIAIEYPQLVGRLVLVSSRRGLDLETERAERRRSDEQWAQLIEAEGVDAFLEKWWKAPLFSTLMRIEPSRLTAELERRRGLSALGLVWALRHLGLGSQPSYQSEVQKIRTKVTVIAGELDDKFVKLGEELVEQFPSAHLVVVKGQGHHLALEAPEALSRAIVEDNPL
jgi:2-succinyl-6-hydroxy-2,4-cyclohexadiene-1-carboxylate synthase